MTSRVARESPKGTCPPRHNRPLSGNRMKRKKNTRQTRSIRQTAPRRREDGRPRGTLKRFPFDETRLGFMLRYEMPVVYHLLRHLCAGQRTASPSSAVTWRSTAGRGSIAGGESGSHPGARPITRVSAAASWMPSSGQTAHGSRGSAGSRHTAGDCCGK